MNKFIPENVHRTVIKVSVSRVNRWNVVRAFSYISDTCIYVSSHIASGWLLKPENCVFVGNFGQLSELPLIKWRPRKIARRFRGASIKINDYYTEKARLTEA